MDMLNERADSTHSQEIGSRSGVFASKEATDSKRNNAADVDGNRDQFPMDQEENLVPDLSTMKAPILNNADLMFTYFKIVVSHTHVSS